jgi:ribokinase
MIAVVGSLNMDLVINSAVIPKPGETVLGTDFKKIPGGKGGNQAAAAARLGSKVTMIGAVGKDDLGEELILSLKKDGVKTEYILKKAGISTGIASIVVEKQTGNNAITVVSGANYALAVEDVERYHFVIEQSNVLLVQLETPLLTIKKALKIARHAGCLSILNPAPAMKLDNEILANIDILTPNEIELERLSGSPANSLEEISAAGNKLLKKGVRQLIVTLGDKGCVSISKDGMDHYPARKVKAVDTTAAGDCFNGALAVALAEGKTIGEAIEFAVSASALSVTKFGAQPSLPYRKDVDAFINKNNENGKTNGGKYEKSNH